MLGRLFVLLIGASSMLSATERQRPAELPMVEANDNRRAAGKRVGDTVVVRLEVRMARWHPEADDGPSLDVPVIAEVDRAPQIPAPLIRVRQGTVVVAYLSNTLPDSSVMWFGVGQSTGDSLALKAGESVRTQFVASTPGTYIYGARVGVVNYEVREREQSYGAMVVDAPGARTDDRVFVMNIWGEPRDSLTYGNALAINGRAWPYNERIAASAGDTLRWRVVNATIRVHPMHLHGFYFRLLAKGSAQRDSAFASGQQPSVVTETMRPFTTMRIDWVAERPGNWLMHCHLAFHVTNEARFTEGAAHDAHELGDARKHMSGLVLGIEVAPRARAVAARERDVRRLRLHVQEGPRQGHAPRTMSFVLQQGTAPAADSVRLPGTPLILTRDQPTHITVLNHLKEHTAVHWHGIELESYSDGVAGWSGAMQRLAPAIAPADSFTARLTLRRAGTFIYHTHLNDIEQLTSGLYGALVVLEPGERYEPRRDHLFVVSNDGPDDARVLVNGAVEPPPLLLDAGVTHRLRFIFIGPVNGNTIMLRPAGDSTATTWRTLARDGHDLPQAQQRETRARFNGWAGQTFDFLFDAKAPGKYLLTSGANLSQLRWSREIHVVPAR